MAAAPPGSRRAGHSSHAGAWLASDSPSFRGASRTSEPGIQKQAPNLYLDFGSGATCRPGMTAKLHRRLHTRASRAAAGTRRRAHPTCPRPRLIIAFPRALSTIANDLVLPLIFLI